MLRFLVTQFGPALAVEGGTELLLETLQTLRRIPHRQPVAFPDGDRRKLSDREILAPVDPVHAHLVVGECQALCKAEPAGGAVRVDVKDRVEDSRGRIGQWRLALGQQARRDQPEVDHPESADDQDRKCEVEHL